MTFYTDNHWQGKEPSFNWWYQKPHKRSSYTSVMTTSLVPPWFKQDVSTPKVDILLEQHVCRLTLLDQILCFLCPEEKICSPLQTTSSTYSHLWTMGRYCHRLYGPSFSHEFGKSIHSHCGWLLYKVYQDCSLTFNQNYYHNPQSFTKYLKLILVFMWSTPLREKFDFGEFFASTKKILILAWRLGTRLSFYGV